MDRFKAYRITQLEKGVRAEFVQFALEELDPGEVVVRVAYSDVNYKDALAATGKGKILLRPSCIGGIDFSGTVVSSSDPRLARGDAVLSTGQDLGVKHHGGYAEYARVPGDWLIRIPRGMSLWDAMAFGTAGFTAGLAILRMEQNGLKPSNGPVLVDGATGGVGSIAILALAKRGYDVVALTGKEGESAYLKELGAKEVMLRKSLDLSRIKPLDRATWAGAVDNLGGEVLAWLCSTMKFGGTIASIGLAASPSLATTVMPFILRGVSLLGINSSDVPARAQREEVWARLAADVLPEKLKTIARTIPFSGLPQVFDDFIASKVRGRIVVDMTE